MASRDYFKGKMVAVIGLGLHGEMMEDVKYLIKAGALVAIYDLRSEARLKNYLVFLRSIGLANYVCGPVPVDDLLDMDMVILSHEYPRDSSFLKEVKANNIPIEYPETVFFKQAPPVSVIGVMGMCGKSTVVSMLAPMLESACADFGDQKLYCIDPESDNGTISHLKKIKSGDIVLMRVTESMAIELHAARMSPHVAIFTTLPSKGTYSDATFELLEYQTYNNFIVGNDTVVDLIHALKIQPKAKMLRTKTGIIPDSWEFVGRGPQDKENASLALQAAKLFKVDDDVAERLMKVWKPLKGRMELVKKLRNVEFYNDTASVVSRSTELALESLSINKNVVLVLGGADNGSDYTKLFAKLPQYAHAVVLVPGSGTMRERAFLREIQDVNIISAPSIEEAARLAMENSRKGDRVLFSPGFEAYGSDGSRKERGERFVRAVRSL
ncbi:MAG: cyanophycin synthetase [Candidatus Taylorbacteria bacterium]